MKNVRSASPRDRSSTCSLMEEEEEGEEEEEREESGGSLSGEGGSEDGRLTMTVEVGGGGRRGEEEVESDGCAGGCEGVVFFSVGEVRRRLSHHVSAPRKTFKRDPDDPSGADMAHTHMSLVQYMCTINCMNLHAYHKHV